MSKHGNIMEDAVALTILSDCLKRMEKQRQSLTTNGNSTNISKFTRIYGSKNLEDSALQNSFLGISRGSVYTITDGPVGERVSLRVRESN